MQDNKPITGGAGQARRRVALSFGTVAKYAVLTVAGIILFRAGAAYAPRERGYSAVGGEAIALLLPVFWYAAEQTVRDIIADVKNGFRPKF